MPEPTAAELVDLLDSVPSPIFCVDLDLRHTFVNAAACRVLGRPREEILGRSLTELGVEAAAARHVEGKFREVLASPEPVFDRTTFPTADGPAVFVGRFARRLGPSGEVTGVAGMGADVTALAATEQALRESEERYRRVLEDQTEVVCRFKADGTFTFVNDVYCRIFGVTAADLIGRAWQPMVHPDDVAHVAARLAVMTPDNPVVRIENRVTTAAGRVRWMEFVNRGFYDPAGALGEVQAVGRDVTDRREAEEARRRAEDAAREEAERAKYERQLLQSQKLESLGVLAGGIAHDFNNLLTVIIGNASLARMNLSAGVSADDELGQIEKASHRAADLCQQMLAYAGRGQFRVQPVDLSQLVQEMAELLAASVSKKAVLRFGLAPVLPPVVGDATQLRQVVMNLITNASDAIGERSGVITLSSGTIDADGKYLSEASLAELPAGRYAYLEVSDTGCGIPDDIRAKIFEPFFTTKFAGRGLGLAAVQGIVRGHKGAIRVYSQQGRGTTFKVLLPADPAAAPARPPAAKTTSLRGRGRRVLVVDDEEDIRVTTRKVLEVHGFEVEVAANGKDGVDSFAARPDAFALVLLDLTMPRMGGAEAFREMRRVRADVRVILTSGFAHDEATAGFEGKGLAGFVRKPFRIDELTAAVFSAVGP